ncbi:colicin E3/pyocin S6 family cytotoxin [Proteus mirabilis]
MYEWDSQHGELEGYPVYPVHY